MKKIQNRHLAASTANGSSATPKIQVERLGVTAQEPSAVTSGTETRSLGHHHKLTARRELNINQTASLPLEGGQPGSNIDPHTQLLGGRLPSQSAPYGAAQVPHSTGVQLPALPRGTLPTPHFRVSALNSSI